MVDTTPKAVNPTDVKPELPGVKSEFTPVTVEPVIPVPQIAPQTNGTASTGKTGHRQLQEPRFTPISPDLSDSIRIAPQDLKREHTRQELTEKGLTPLTKEFSYIGTTPMTRAEKIQPGERLGDKPGSTGYQGDWYAVQPEETRGGIGPREYGQIPEKYEELISECETAESDYEAISRELEDYAREHNYRDYLDNPGYWALSAEQFRIWQRYQALEEAKDAAEVSMGERIGGVIAGTTKKTAGELVSAAGTALEMLAQYGNSPWQIEVMNFDPSMPVPERDTTLVREYVTDPARDFGGHLVETGTAQIQEQKEGLGKFGQFAVDLGSAATQMVLDAGLGALTGGGMAVSAAIRTFGGSAAEARADGASLEQQMLYATTSATLSYGIEHLCNVAFSGLKMIAPGISDELVTEGVEKLAWKLASSPDGAELLLKLGTGIVSGVSEGGEEFLEAALQPFLQKLIYDPDAKTILDNPDLWSDYAYEALVGGVLGMSAGGVNINTDIESVQTDLNYGILQSGSDSQTKLAEIGRVMLDMGIIPGKRYLDAMGIDEATARGYQSIVWMSLDSNPEAQRTMEALVDLTEEHGVVKTVITDGSHIENGRLKPNVIYQTGEHAYFYETNADGLVVRAYTEGLQLKIHDGRLDHNPNTYGKQQGDHAGHLFGDRFGGSPELDNLVSQASRVNLSEYKVIENQWANALKSGKKVSVNIDIKYDTGNSRPVAFKVTYEIDGVRTRQIINN